MAPGFKVDRTKTGSFVLYVSIGFNVEFKYCFYRHIAIVGSPHLG